MLKKIISFIGSTIFLLSFTLSNAHADLTPAAGETVPGFPCTKVGQTSVYADRTGVKKITCKKFGKFLLWDFGVPAYPVPTTEVADAQQKATVVVSASPKPTPTNIPGTSFKWPTPSGDLNKYSGIPKEGHAEDLLGLKKLHEAGITGKGYSLAFIDATIVTDNPAFEKTEMVCVGALDPLLNFGERACPSKYPDYSHGQGVAGTMGGAYGVAPGARLISIDVEFEFGVSLTVPDEKRSAIVRGLQWVLAHYKEYKIAAVSVSVGDKASRANTVCGIASPIGLYEVVKKLSEADVAVIFSTANAATINWVREPNCLPGVIAVASVASDDPRRIADYSSISPDIDLLAPADFMSAGMNGKDAVFGGTSQAAPFAAGLFALGKEARPDANIAQIFYFIKQSAAPVSDVFVKRIPVVLPAEMVKALQSAKTLPPIKLVKQIQIKSGR